MLNDFQHIDLFPLSIYDVVLHLLVSVLCGLFISVVYRITYRGPSYSRSFTHSLVLLTMITSIVILVIGNNLARAFGLVGAMSIIRFRTAVRDTQDIVFIFFSLTIGMAAGVGLTLLAVVGTLMISLVIVLLVNVRFGEKQKQQHLLQISYQNSEANGAKLPAILSRYCRQVKLMNMKNAGPGGELEAFYQVVLKRNLQPEDLIRELNAIPEVFGVNLFFDEDDGYGTAN